MQSTLDTVFSFFETIRLPYRLEDLSEPSFLPGILIRDGTLIVDLAKLKYPGDLLHEAGHIAVTPEVERPRLSGDLKYAGHTGAEETAAIAWSYAACKHLELPANVVFHPNGYKGASTNLIEAFESGGGFGFPLLGYWNMCEVAHYPTMTSWLRGGAKDT